VKVCCSTLTTPVAHDGANRWPEWRCGWAPTKAADGKSSGLARRHTWEGPSCVGACGKAFPNGSRVGTRFVTFEACSGFTRITSRRIAQTPKATLVARPSPAGNPAKPIVSFGIIDNSPGAIFLH
jgi:hypothetical protein